MTFGSVGDFAWADRRAVLAITIETDGGAGNAVQVYDAVSQVVRVLESSTSIYRGLAWREIEILPNRRGKPLVYLHGLARQRGEKIGMRGIDVSLTHEGDLAIAVVAGMSDDAPIDRTEHRERLVEWLKEQGRM